MSCVCIYEQTLQIEDIVRKNTGYLEKTSPKPDASVWKSFAGVETPREYLPNRRVYCELQPEAVTVRIIIDSTQSTRVEEESARAKGTPVYLTCAL